MMILLKRVIEMVKELTDEQVSDHLDILEAELAVKYGFTKEQVSKMVDIYPGLSLEKFFTEKNLKECLIEILVDKGKQPIPVESSSFTVDKDDIEIIVEKVDGKSVKKEVVYKPVFIVKLLNSDEAGKIFSRIPSNSEMTSLMKVEYNRRKTGKKLEGAFLRISQIQFEDKTGSKRDGYAVEKITQFYVDMVKTRTPVIE